jgi:hypothetical protein
MEKALEKELEKLNASDELLKYNESIIPSLDLNCSINKHIVKVKEKVGHTLRDIKIGDETTLGIKSKVNYKLGEEWNSHHEKINTYM